MKNPLKLLVIASVLPLAACVSNVPDDTVPSNISAGSLQALGGPGRAVELSEEVRAVARPGQNLESVRLFNDGCYWTEYSGVVEDTYLPLETRDSRPICTRGEGTPISDL